MNQYTVLAEFINAQENPPVQVPQNFSLVLDRAIAIREYYSNTLLPQQDASDRQSKTRHAVLLEALIKVRHILAPRYADGFAIRTQTPDSLEELQDMFVNVDLGVNSFLSTGNLRSLVTPRSHSKEEAKYEAELPGGIEEDFLVAQLLIGDFSRLRSTVGQTWEGYKRGTYDLVTASLVTDLAMNLARSLEDSCKEHFVEHGGIKDMLYFIYYRQCINHGTFPEYKEKPGDEFNFLMYDIADSMFIIPLSLMILFLDIQQPGMIPEFKSGILSEYDPTSDRTKKSAREKFNEDQSIALKMLSEFAALITEFEPSPAEDEMTRTLRDMLETRDITFTTGLATQLFLDIHSRLRDQVERVFFKLSTVASFTRKSIKETLEFHKDLQITTLSAEHELQLTTLSNDIFKYFLSDPHRVACKDLQRSNIPPPYYLLRQHPWACGLWKYYIQIQIHPISIQLTNNWGTIISCAHLYSVMLEERLLRREWLDMKLLLGIRDTKDFSLFFIGSAPRSPGHYLKHFNMAVGTSAAVSTSECAARLPVNMKRIERGPRGLTEMAPVMQTFKHRYCCIEPSSELRAQDVRRVLEQRARREKICSKHFAGSAIAPLRKVSITTFLQILRIGIQDEMIELAFDYLTLHRTCWHLLRSVRDRCHDQLVAQFGPTYIKEENQLSRITGYILAECTGNSATALLKDAAAVLTDMLQANAGNQVCKSLGEKLGTPVIFQDEIGGESSLDQLRKDSHFEQGYSGDLTKD